MTDVGSQLFSEGTSPRNVWTEAQIEELERLSPQHAFNHGACEAARQGRGDAEGWPHEATAIVGGK